MCFTQCVNFVEQKFAPLVFDCMCQVFFVLFFISRGNFQLSSVAGFSPLQMKPPAGTFTHKKKAQAIAVLYSFRL